MSTHRDRLQVFSLLALCLLLETSTSSRVSQSNNSEQRFNQSDCSVNATLCPKHFNQQCNLTTGSCFCPPSEPILLSSEIPCLKAKLLGQVCLHSLECSQVAHSACFATILFPLELQSIPTHRQWYIYSQITESGELNYLLNKVYGQCRCKSGYRAVSPRKCVSKSASTGHRCHNATQCTLSDSHCDLHLSECLCNDGFTFDAELNACNPLKDRHNQFCVVSSDCQVKDPNLQCTKSKCVCAQGPRRGNQTLCPPPLECEIGQAWNSSTFTCEAPSPAMLNSLLVKIVLLLLLKLIIINLVRISCYSKRLASQHEQSGLHRSSRFFDTSRQSDQSRSLLSLPPYEAICSEGMNDGALPEERDCHLPSYDEAVQSMRAGGGYKGLNTSQPESELH